MSQLKPSSAVAPIPRDSKLRKDTRGFGKKPAIRTAA